MRVCYFIGFLISCSCLATPQQSLRKQVDSAVVCIKSRLDENSKPIYGTGFFIAPRVIVTTYHLLKNAKEIDVRLSNRQTVKATLSAIDRNSDIALLDIPIQQEHFFKIESVEPDLGESVFTIGCPFGLEHSLSQGVVSHPNRTIGGKDMIQTDIAINMGNSGSPLVNQNGNVLGMIFGFLQETNGGINFAIPVARLVDLQNKYQAENASVVAKLWKLALATPQPDQRILFYKSIIGKSPWLPEAYYNLGIAYQEMNKYVEAAENYKQAIRQNPDYHQAYSNLGLALFKTGKIKDARNRLLKAVSINPNDPTILLNLGLVYADGFSDYESARQAYMRYLQLEPDTEESSQIRRWLQNHFP